MTETPDPINNLARKHFAIDYIFPYQRLVISNILRLSGMEGFIIDEDYKNELSPLQIVLLPTGAGKSLCFMLPAFFLEGITLVVFPLLSLLSDQLRRTIEAGLNTVILRGGQSREERKEIFGNCLSGNVKMILTNPETLCSPDVRKTLERARISHLVIDEAHTVSEWGDTFRPAYLELGNIIKTLNPELVTAFTATASGHVLKRIKEVVFFNEVPNVVFGNPDRTNISYSVIKSKNRNQTLLRKAADSPKPLIVFTSSRTGAQLTAKLLRRNLSCSNVYFYHAGLSKEEKSTVENWFFKSDDGILVATTAYGMGVDKGNIRTVIHLDPPPTVESYLQESGRAGRDRLPAKAILIYSDTVRENMSRIKNDLARKRYHSMVEYGENIKTCRREFLLKELDSSPEICHGCDICNDSIEQEVYPREILEIIKRNKRRFTKKELLFFLKGYGTPHLRERMLQKIKGFGTFSSWETDMLDELLVSMVKSGTLRLPVRGPGKYRITTGKSDMNGSIKGFFGRFHKGLR